MQHKVKVTVLDKKLFKDLQEEYCANPESGVCGVYNIGDEYTFERYGGVDSFWHGGMNTLTKTSYDNPHTCGNATCPHCSEAWDAISRYIYTGLQGGSIMRGWMKDERVMIASCNDGTRPVIFKIQRMDYKAVYIEGIGCDNCRNKIQDALMKLDGVTDVTFRDGFTEVYMDYGVKDSAIQEAVESCGSYHVVRID